MVNWTGMMIIYSGGVVWYASAGHGTESQIPTAEKIIA